MSPCHHGKRRALLTVLCSSASYWVGHSYCNGTSNQWSCCGNQYGDPNNRENFPFNNKQKCWCPEDDAMIAFSAPSKIPDVAYLDLGQPGKISYFPGYTPSTTADDSSTTSSTRTRTSEEDFSTPSAAESSRRTRATSGSSTTTNSPASSRTSLSSGSSSSQTPASQATSSASTASQNSGLSTGTKIGIGVGVSAGALISAALIWLLLSFLRRRRRGPPPPIEEQIRPKSFGSYAGISGANSSEGANGDLRSPAWSGHKSELPADENTVVSPRITSTSTMAEVEGSTPRQSVQSQPSIQSVQPQPRPQSQSLGQNTSLHPTFDSNQIRQYKPYRPSDGQNLQSIHEMPG